MEAPYLVITTLLSVEMALLIISIALLLMSRREHAGRNKLIEALVRATRELTRYEYFLAVIESIMDSKKKIYGIATGRKPSTQSGREMLNKILDAIREASRRGVKIRYILHPSPERISIAYQYQQAGAEVRLHPYSGIADGRYMLVDDNTIVIGLAGKEREHPTRTGFILRSSSLSQIMENHFNTLWEEAIPLEKYINTVIEEYRRAHNNLKLEEVASHLGIPKEYIEKNYRSLLAHEGM